MPTMSHKQVKTRQGFFVDEGIAEIISTINELPHLETFTSCQGGSESFELAYVMFAEPRRFCVSFLNRMVREMDKIWNDLSKKGKLLVEVSPNNWQHGEIDFYFMIALGDGYIMRWHPSITKYVLQAVKKISLDKYSANAV